MGEAGTYVVCSLEEIPSRKARGFQLLRRTDAGAKVFSLVVVRWGRQVIGYVNQCPHGGSHLDWERNGFLDPTGLRLLCGKHGALFEIATGRCVSGPCRGQALQPASLTVVDGDVCIEGLDLVEDVDTGASER